MHQAKAITKIDALPKGPLVNQEMVPVLTGEFIGGGNMMRKFLAIAILVFTLCFCVTLVATAGPVLERIVKRGELIVGTAGTMPPLNMTTKTGEIIGLDADISKAMANAMGVKIRFKTMPFANLLNALNTGEVDLVLSSMTMLPKRNLEVAFVGPYFISGKGILTTEKKSLVLDSISALNEPGRRLAALEKSTSQVFVERLTPRAELVKVSNYVEALDMLIQGKADALIADLPYCMVTAYRYEEKGLTTIDKPLTFEPLAIALPEGDPLLVNFAENFLKMLDGSGELERLTKRWFRSDAWMDQLP
jgi:polar amino acid transport system substrate-binding protein